MVNENILTALQNSINKGDNLQTAKSIMINSGYDANEVEEASNFIGGNFTQNVQPRPGEPNGMGNVDYGQVRQLGNIQNQEGQQNNINTQSGQLGNGQFQGNLPTQQAGTNLQGVQQGMNQVQNGANFGQFQGNPPQQSGIQSNMNNQMQNGQQQPGMQIGVRGQGIKNGSGVIGGGLAGQTGSLENNISGGGQFMQSNNNLTGNVNNKVGQIGQQGVGVNTGQGIQMQERMQKGGVAEKVKQKKSYALEIGLFFILLSLIGVLIATFFFKEQILSFLSS